MFSSSSSSSSSAFSGSSSSSCCPSSSGGFSSSSGCCNSPSDSSSSPSGSCSSSSGSSSSSSGSCSSLYCSSSSCCCTSNCSFSSICDSSSCSCCVCRSEKRSSSSKYFAHNKRILKDVLEPGYVVKFMRANYVHVGIYIGHGQVIHKVNDNGGQIIEQCFWEIVEDSKVTAWNSLNGKRWPHGQERVVERAKSRLGRSSYNALTNNCEHFARWCFNGVEKSEQAERKTLAVAYGTLTTAVTGALAIGTGPIGAGLAFGSSLVSWWTTGKVFHAD